MTAAYDPTYQAPSTGWTVQLNSAASGGTGPSHMGTVAGSLGFGSTTVNGVKQSSAVGGASGPLSSTAADPSASGAVSIDLEKRFVVGNIKPSHASDAAEGVY